MIDAHLLKEAIAEAKARVRTEISKMVTHRVVVADTLAKAKAQGNGCSCPSCHNETRYYGRDHPPVNQDFKDVSYFYVHTDDPELWHNLISSMKASNSHGPIFTYLT